jgi:hypothetical protein
MARKCTICQHHQRLHIDEALIAGGSLRGVAARFGVTASSVGRHKAKCIAASLMLAQNAREIAYGDTLMEQVEIQRDYCLRLQRKAEEAGDLKTSVAAARTVLSHLELLGRVSGELATSHQPSINIDVGSVLRQLEERTMRDITPRAEVVEFMGNGRGSSEKAD